MSSLDRLGYLEHPAGNFRSPAGLVISCQGLNALMVPSCRIKFLCTELVEYSNANILGPEVANANVQSCAVQPGGVVSVVIYTCFFLNVDV